MASSEMLDVPLFMANRVLDNIFVGGCYAAEDRDFVFTNSVTRVINCCSHTFTNCFQGVGIRYLSYQFDEDGNSTMFDSRDETITQVVRFVNEAVEKDECVLIHSVNGDSRSVVLLAGYLVHRFHWPPHRALQFITTKRFSSKPHQNYVRQLHEFANRRRTKYGEFKDIFGSTRGLKLNHQEILHRNTFLNAVMAQPNPEELVRQKGIHAILSDCQIHVEVPPAPEKHITWRDGLVTAQIPSTYANFDANGRPVGSQSSLIFRPRTPSYRSGQQVRCIPVRMDPSLLPAISFDLDLPLHKRRSDGYLAPVTSSLEGYAVVAKPVSILAKVGTATRSAYDASSVYVPRDEFEAILVAPRGEDVRNESISERSDISRQSDRPTSARRPQSTMGMPPVHISQMSATQKGQGVGGMRGANPSYGKALGSNYENQKAARQNAAPLLANVALTKMGQAGQGAYNRTSSDPNVRSGSLTKLRPPTPPRKLEELAAEAAAAAAAQQAGDQSAAHMTQQAYSHAQQHIYSQQQTPQMSQAQQQAHTSARMSQPNRMSSSYSAGSSPGMSRSAQPRGSMSSRGSDYMQPRTPTQQGSTGTRPVSGPSRYAPAASPMTNRGSFSGQSGPRTPTLSNRPHGSQSPSSTYRPISAGRPAQQGFSGTQSGRYSFGGY